MNEEHSHKGFADMPREPGHHEEVRPHVRTYVTLLTVFTAVASMAAFHYAVRGFHRYPEAERFVIPASSANRGRTMIHQYGCAGCHTIPGIAGADGEVGPRLDRVRKQAYIAGVLPNSPQNMVVWIQNPREVDPRTAMPDLGVNEADARDMAAYLYAPR